MDFSCLEEQCRPWRDRQVIGRTIQREKKIVHVLGMGLAEEACLYVLEPYTGSLPGSKAPKFRSARQQRKAALEEQGTRGYLEVRSVTIGEKQFEIQGGTSGSLGFSLQDYGVIQIFVEMIDAGWQCPEILRETDWNRLQLTTLHLPKMEHLPEVTADTPITFLHQPDPVQHLLEKKFTLTVGKPLSFSFADVHGKEHRAYFDEVKLMDPWESLEARFADPKVQEMLSSEQLKQQKEMVFAMLDMQCPRGMRYLMADYACDPGIQLELYARQALSAPMKSSSGGLMFRVKPERELDSHGLPLHTWISDMPLSPDTEKLPVEALSYAEKVPAWEENI